MKTTLLLLGFLAAVGAMAPEAAKPLKNPPLAYFDSHCSRCHGAYGSNYGVDFGKGQTTAQLRKVVEEMSAGPGGEALTGVDLDAQTAFHQEIIAKKPFIDWTGQKGRTLSGEVTPKATVELVLRDRKLPATIDVDGNWTVSYPEGAALAKAKIEATLGKAVTAIPLDTRAYSLP
jgi:hypothetical protein